MAQGEILQLEKSRKLTLLECEYYQIIEYKTASLFGCCCELAAFSNNLSEKNIQYIYQFGIKLGLMFQIKDDLFDIMGSQDGLGKPIGFDVKKNMITLPFIYFLSSMSSIKRRYYRLKLRFYARKKDLNEIKKIITKSGAIKYSEDLMYKISDEAINELNIFEESDAKKALTSLVKYNLERTT